MSAPHAVTDGGVLLSELPYREDSAPVFEQLLDQPWPVFLDSGPPGKARGRFDILSAAPMTVLVARGLVTEVRTHEGVSWSEEEPFELLRHHLQPWAGGVHGLPFAGGALGYFAYDLARRIERLPSLATDTDGLPELAVGIYDWALVVDHRARRSYLVGRGRDPATRAQWSARVRRLSVCAPRVGAEFQVTGETASNAERAVYARAFHRIKDYIRAGDCYQVNFAQRFSVTTRGDPWLAYRALRRVNAAPYAAYLSTPSARLLSLSPEQFLQVEKGQVTTRPIKGTAARADDPERDRALAATLLDSAKDRAENLMIVDLLRNDLGKSCVPGSIEVPRLFALESYATVHHLVSTVTGRLAPGRDALDLLRGCFPGGSITGAPKLRAMEIIEELEPHRRAVYCGAIGYVGFDGRLDTNIAIRTLTHQRDVMRFWAGGGIVADSELETEYQETFVKVAAMLELLRRPRAGIDRVGG